jgi:beta-carotene 15,15'-dioxygenase
MKDIEKIGKLIGMGTCAAYFLFFEGNKLVEWSLVAGIILLIGIPHGAIDHLLANPQINRKELKGFVLKYLEIIVAYLIVWIFFPLIALLAFLLMSAFHFGQSHFIGIGLRKMQIPTYILTGTFYLSVIFWSDFELTREILADIVSIKNLEIYGPIIIFGCFAGSTLLYLVNLGRKGALYILEMLVVGTVLLHLPLLVGFAIYFGFWHALPSIGAEYDYIKGYLESNKLKKFVLKLLPFSLMSFIGIGIILSIFVPRADFGQLTLLFFVLISLISAPHIWHMHAFLSQRPS